MKRHAALVFFFAASAGCAADVQLGFEGCKLGERTVAVGALSTGPCGERCVCKADGTLDCGTSLCPDPDPDPDPVPQPCFARGFEIQPGTTVRVDEIACVSCTCPAGGKEALPDGDDGCVAITPPVCEPEPFCGERTPDTCDTCGVCTCLMPPMGCVPPQPGCTFPEEGNCVGGDWCGPPSCNPTCQPPPLAFPMDDPTCFQVVPQCDRIQWFSYSVCPCGILEPSTCDQLMVVPTPGCRVDATCDPNMQTARCDESCMCITAMDCPGPGQVFDPDPSGLCGRCAACATCQQLQCPMEYPNCVDDPQLGCGTCF